jgi:hypothetical protein
VAQPPLNQKPFHNAAPHEELTGTKSIIEQWRRATAPLKGTGTDSDHNERNISSDIKEMSMSQEAPLSSQHVNQIAQQSGEQTVEPPKPIGTETFGVQHAAPSLLEASTTDHAIIDDKFAKQSIIDERPREPKQTNARTNYRCPSSFTTYQGGKLRMGMNSSGDHPLPPLPEPWLCCCGDEAMAIPFPFCLAFVLEESSHSHLAVSLPATIL